MIRRSSRRAFFRSIGRSIGRCVRAHSYQLNWIPSCPVLPLAYIPWTELFYRGSPSVSASRFCFQTRSTRSSFACITGTTTIFVRVPCRLARSLARMFVRSSLHLVSSSSSVLRSSVTRQKRVFTRRTTIRPLYASCVPATNTVLLRHHDHHSLSNTAATRFLRAIEIISTETDSARLMPVVRFDEIRTYRQSRLRYACVCHPAN